MIKPLPDAYNENEAFILVKPLADGDLAIGIFNFSDTQRELSLEFWDMGIPYAAGVSLSLHDCITGKNWAIYRAICTGCTIPWLCGCARAHCRKVEERSAE